MVPLKQAFLLLIVLHLFIHLHDTLFLLHFSSLPSEHYTASDSLNCIQTMDSKWINQKIDQSKSMI